LSSCAALRCEEAQQQAAIARILRFGGSAGRAGAQAQSACAAEGFHFPNRHNL
jgi:hypothetical protein